jgi:ADP-L-glycero-D-manno-heptose 6-epimerase
MNKNATIVITGAAGFIGSTMIGFLNHLEYENLILVDKFDDKRKLSNLLSKRYRLLVERESFFEWYNNKGIKADFIFHFGARTDTTEFDYSIHQHLNVDYSKKIWNLCIEKNVPLVYASSAATYGDGAFGYDDNDLMLIERLKPLNPYGISKNEFDKWVLLQKTVPPFWVGLKFFNVYGPNEYHKGRMASVIYHSFNQISQSGKMKLFRSHKNEFKDGEQFRDFIYVKDIVKVCYWLMENQPTSSIYNLGTGKAESFNNLVNFTYAAMRLKPVIEYIDIPIDIRDKYQYYTEAKMNKLRAAGYNYDFYSLDDGIKDYTLNYLCKGSYF